MSLSAKHKDLLKQRKVRSKELSDFMADKQDNITAEDYKRAKEITADIKKIDGEIDQERKLRGLQHEVNGLTSPATRGKHPGHAEVLGAKKTGETEVRYAKTADHKRAVKVIKDAGAGILSREAGYDSSAHEVIHDPGYKRAMRQFFAKGPNAARRAFRNFEVGLDPQGGTLAPAEVLARLVQKVAAPTRVSQLCSSYTSSRDAMSVPRVNYTGASDDPLGQIYSTGMRVTLTDENPTSDTQALVNDANMFGSARIANYTFLIEGVLTQNVVEDAMFDPVSWMIEKFGETSDLLKDNMAINGSGIGQPGGMLMLPGASDTLAYPPTVNSGRNDAPFLTPDGLINLTEDIPEQYDDNIYYLYRKTTTGKTIRTFKDGQNRYLFGRGTQDSGLVNGRQMTLNGYPVIHSPFMPTPAASVAGQYPIIAGDFRAYTRIDRIGFSVQILREVAARRNQIIVLGRLRFGGQVLEPWRLRVQKVAA